LTSAPPPEPAPAPHDEPAVAPPAAAPEPALGDVASPEPDAAPDSAADADAEVVVLAERIRRAPGAVHLLGAEVLERYKYDDPHATLQLVPGVYVRQEDGFGLRPNIGIRGAISDRSSKVALSEDG